MNTAQPQHFSPGFSIIGFIGMLAVIAVIATLSAPSFIKRADRAAWVREKADLQSFSNALVLSIIRNQSISNANELPQTIGLELGQPVSSISTTPRRLARAFIYKPDGWLGTNPLPYIQSASGHSVRPTNATLMILSTMAEPLPTISTSDFDTLWTTAEGAKPSVWSTTWAGRGEDLQIQRLDLSPLFHKLLLVNADRNANAPYAIESGSTITIASLNQAQGFYLYGTLVSLFYKGGTTLQCRELLTKDTSLTFQNGRWSRDLPTPKDVTGEFAWWIEQFLQPPAPVNPAFAATQQSVVMMLYYYLWGYSVWAGTPPGLQTFAEPGSVQNYPPYAALMSTPNGYQPNLINFSKNIISLAK